MAKGDRIGNRKTREQRRTIKVHSSNWKISQMFMK